MLDIYHFGKGVGECSLVKLPDGTWIIIDSFVDDGVPVAKSFLDAKGIPLASVKLICLSHWHDDHVRGSSELFNLCSSAEIAIPMLMAKDEFKAFLDARELDPSSTFSSGVNELFGILKTLKERGKRPILCCNNKVIWRSSGGVVESLSPSDADIGDFLVNISEWSRSFDASGRIPSPNRNDTSVAMVVDAHNVKAVFGADLEIRKEDSGWQAVCDKSWQNRGQAGFFKIAHHGSPNADYEPFWQKVLEANVVAVLSPYGRGRTKRPSEDDIKRIKNRTNLAFSSCLLGWRKPSQLHRTVEKTLSESGIQIWEEPKNSGVVHTSYCPEKQTWNTVVQAPAGML